ncbi:MAG: BPSS1780 family membrane protein [Proteobacteria bacterium]|nr:BPSS1780 family membrane protein [Pseudomonadota bacterium]
MNIVPAINGWLWVRSGFALFRKNPALWLALVFAYWLLMAVANVLVSAVPVIGPWLGLAVTSVLIPAFSVSFMVFSRELAHGRPVGMPLLVSGFRENLPALITLGGLYLLATLLVLGASALADGGLLARWMLFGQKPSPEALAQSGLVLALALASLVYTPVLMAWWFAPALAAWRGLGAAQSLFYSFFAGLRNWRAFLVYGLAFGLIGGVAPAIVLIIALAVRPSSALFSSILIYSVVPAVLMLVPTLFASFYASYTDIFAPAEDETPESADKPLPE